MAYKIKKQYRLYGYDYSQNGKYFITIVTRNREHYFGTIDTPGQIRLSKIGEFIKFNILQVRQQKRNVQIDEWVIMPNHVHLILSINSTEEKEYSFVTGIRPLVQNSISSFVNHFKGLISRWCKENGQPHFAWQSRFHDRIIRDDQEYEAIANYINTNIANWKNDSENL
jgi:REP element-mobilizing transposase RayT